MSIITANNKFIEKRKQKIKILYLDEKFVL